VKDKTNFCPEPYSGPSVVTTGKVAAKRGQVKPGTAQSIGAPDPTGQYCPETQASGVDEPAGQYDLKGHMLTVELKDEAGQ
jgi:hypothetical protein